jgi:acetyl-CoA synthetase
MNAEDPLFILYTSGSTGKPKGVLHTTGGYAVWASMTHVRVRLSTRPDLLVRGRYRLGHRAFLCRLWPLANGATTVMFEGVPNFPIPAGSGRWSTSSRSKSSMAPRLRALMREATTGCTRPAAILAPAGIGGRADQPEAWEWYHKVVGEGRCPIVDTWWQTETGGAMITPLPGATALKPGSASKPMFGVQPALLDNDGLVLDGATDGCLVIGDSWPGQMRTVWGDHERFFQTYFTTFKGWYFTGDGCRRDEDGYYWITGRIDDVINVSGHRMGTAEIESALVAHAKVAEAAVVGMPHAIKGQGIYAYVTCNAEVEPDEALRRELVAWVRHEIGPIATPDVIQFAPGLPKTRSGKIMRRILRKIAENDLGSLGDTSTLADPSVVDNLIANRPVLATA